jgi:hypothetical protein
MSRILISPCQSCRHYAQNSSGELLTCEAFPGGIPDAILSGDNDHKRPFPGDQGICYEPVRAPCIISREPEEIRIGRVNLDIDLGDEIIRRGEIDITIQVNPIKERFGDRYT